jgi:hypothetical protein
MEKEGKLHAVNNFSLISVLYRRDAADFRFLERDAKTVAEIAERVVPFLLGLTKEWPSLDDTYEPFIRCTSRYKHSSGFEEEQEVRMVYVRPSKVAAPEPGPPLRHIHFRQTAAGAVPYVSLFDGKDLKLPVTRIIVGPHPLAERRRRTIEAFLDHAEIDASVSISSIPYLPR